MPELTNEINFGFEIKCAECGLDLEPYMEIEEPSWKNNGLPIIKVDMCPDCLKEKQDKTMEDCQWNV